MNCKDPSLQPHEVWDGTCTHCSYGMGLCGEAQASKGVCPHLTLGREIEPHQWNVSRLWYMYCIYVYSLHDTCIIDTEQYTCSVLVYLSPSMLCEYVWHAFIFAIWFIHCPQARLQHPEVQLPWLEIYVIWCLYNVISDVRMIYIRLFTSTSDASRHILHHITDQSSRF